MMGARQNPSEAGTPTAAVSSFAKASEDRETAARPKKSLTTGAAFEAVQHFEGESEVK
jgi:hypothetical protein